MKRRSLAVPLSAAAEVIVGALPAPVLEPQPLPLSLIAPQAPQVGPEPLLEPKIIEEVASLPIHAAPAPELPSDSAGFFLLQGIDALVGGLHFLRERIAKSGQGEEDSIMQRIEALLYAPLPQENISVNPKSTEESLAQLDGFSYLAEEMLRHMPSFMQDINSIKIEVGDGASFFLDGQMVSLWPSAQIPADFSIPVKNARERIGFSFLQGKSLVLAMAEGNDIPAKEFVQFLLWMNLKQPFSCRITLSSPRHKQGVPFETKQENSPGVIFGLWPWQFSKYRKVKISAGFSLYHSKYLIGDIYLAPVEVVLHQPVLKEEVFLCGYALKTSVDGKIRVVLLTTAPEDKIGAQEILDTYLSHWPNLEEGFEDISRKIEFFNYTERAMRIFSPEEEAWGAGEAGGWGSFLSGYRNALDAYLRWHFLPYGYEDKGLSLTQERFYSLPCRLEKEEHCSIVRFIIPEGYAFQQEMDYLCRRMNERRIILRDGSLSLYRVRENRP